MTDKKSYNLAGNDQGPNMLITLLRGAGQVMFQTNIWSGMLFIAGILFGAYHSDTGIVAWGALVGLTTSTLTGYMLGLSVKDGSDGLWGFNGILVGCAFPTFIGNTVLMWFALILCAALTTWVRYGFNNVMKPWKVNSLTFPFVFCTWIFLLAARTMHGIPPTHMAEPTLPGMLYTEYNLNFVSLLECWLKGFSQVFLIDSWITGILFLVGLFIGNRWAALWASIGSAIALLCAITYGASEESINSGLYGFSPILTAIALGSVFYKPAIKSAIWALLGICCTIFIQAAMNVLVCPFGIATLTAPFCITTWLFLLPLVRFDNSLNIDHSNWHTDNKRHLK